MKPAQILQVIIAALVGLITPMLSQVGEQALDVAERAALVPEKDIDRLATGMSDPDKFLLRKMFRKLADVLSDIVIFLTSRGKIRPDGESDYNS